VKLPPGSGPVAEAGCPSRPERSAKSATPSPAREPRTPEGTIHAVIREPAATAWSRPRRPWSACGSQLDVPCPIIDERNGPHVIVAQADLEALTEATLSLGNELARPTAKTVGAFMTHWSDLFEVDYRFYDGYIETDHDWSYPDALDLDAALLESLRTSSSAHHSGGHGAPHGDRYRAVDASSCPKGIRSELRLPRRRQQIRAGLMEQGGGDGSAVRRGYPSSRGIRVLPG
jgi:hypothetical protein